MSGYHVMHSRFEFACIFYEVQFAQASGMFVIL